MSEQLENPFATIARFQIAPPVDVERIADAFGLSVYHQDLGSAVSAMIQRDAVRGSLQHNLHTPVIARKLLPMVLDQLRRQNIVTQISVLVLGQQHQHVNRPVFKLEFPCAILFFRRVQPHFSPPAGNERPRTVLLERVSFVHSVQPFRCLQLPSFIIILGIRD